MRATLFTVLLVAILPPTAEERLNVPFRLHREHLVLVQGSIGSLQDLVLLIDTGAARTIVERSVASSIELKGTPNDLYAFGQRISAEEVVLPALNIGGRRTVNPSVLLTDLTGTAASLQLSRLDAIVGIDILRRTSFAIDYSRKELQFGAPVALPHRTAFIRHRLLPVIEAVASGTRVHLVVDSGASHVALFGFAGGSGPALILRGEAVRLGGAAAVKPVLLEYLEIGAWRRQGVVALAMDRRPGEATRADGVLGLPALDASFVQFDFISQELGWKP